MALYHKEVFFPEGMAQKCINFLFKGDVKADISYHLCEQIGGKPNRQFLLAFVEDLNNFKTGEVFEVETNVNGDVEKVCVRAKYDDKRDVSAVYIRSRRSESRLFAKTAWSNYSTDLHSTLDASKYVSGRKETV